MDVADAALITDLKQRGMLDDTLIVWGGEFGRTPMAQSNKGGVGRDHHMRAFSMFLAGGGIRGGMTYGNTDEFGYHAAENPVHVKTTCTPRCYTCWASTTPDSPIATKAATSASPMWPGKWCSRFWRSGLLKRNKEAEADCHAPASV